MSKKESVRQKILRALSSSGPVTIMELGALLYGTSYKGSGDSRKRWLTVIMADLRGEGLVTCLGPRKTVYGRPPMLWSIA